MTPTPPPTPLFQTFPYIMIYGQDLVYWSGMIAGIAFFVVIISAIIKQFNVKGWVKYQLPMTNYHHIFGWLAVALTVLHVILAIVQFNFKIFL